ncbi:vacuolar protein sorting-associated protein vps5 [Planoprotostelium fungivorum]|uniref:Vacuolar protein sorting-associated protein vps5 n=1 Tax=Planoprotostelium fungivorum TaxID=1890364 RepID=A0A2P6MNB7_9EUKA|nr:vacuolar protein sorting-associated protein vps5 [Planoprotostelium fungivorum]
MSDEFTFEAGANHGGRDSQIEENNFGFSAGQLDAPSDEAAVVPISRTPSASFTTAGNSMRKSGGPASYDREYVSPTSPFRIKISNPAKVESGLLNTHSEYPIHVQTTLNFYKSSEFTVTRRYSDFDWLRERLAENNKGYLIPPLPEKGLINRFNSEFVEYRRKELEKFLIRVVNHHHLCQSPDLLAFLETNKPEGGQVRKSVEKSSEKEAGSGFFSFLATTPAAMGTVADPDPWFENKKNYITSLETHFQMLIKNLNAYMKKKKENVNAFAEFGVACSLTASVEADQDSITSSSFNRFSDVITQANELEERRMNEEVGVFEDSLRDYARLLQAVKEMLNARQEKLNAYHYSFKSLETKREKMEKTKGNAKLEQEVAAAQDTATKSELEFNQVSAISRNELQQFEAMKLNDIKALLIQYTQININFELQMADYWKSLMSDLQA